MINRLSKQKPYTHPKPFSFTACQISAELDIRSTPKKPHTVGKTKFREDMQKLLKGAVINEKTDSKNS